MPADHVVRNLFTSNIYIIISYVFASVLYYLYGKKSLDICFKCGVVSYLLGSIVALIVKFPKESILYLLTASSDDTSLLWLTEVNDLTFAFGIIFLYYLFQYKNKTQIKSLFVCGLMIFWGLKRIEIVAIIVCFVFFKIFVNKLKFFSSE